MADPAVTPFCNTNFSTRSGCSTANLIAVSAPSGPILTAIADAADASTRAALIWATNASTGAVINNVVFNYTSFQTAAATSTGGGFNVRCTNSLPYTLALNNSGVTDDAVNLAYTLSLSAASGTGNG